MNSIRLKGYSMIEIRQEMKYEIIVTMQSPNDRERACMQ